MGRFRLAKEGRLKHLAGAPGPLLSAGLITCIQVCSPLKDPRPARLGVSLEEFVGHPAYDIAGLRADLERFAFCSAAAMVNRASALTGSLPVWRSGAS